jgi:hypothetical protein
MNGFVGHVERALVREDAPEGSRYLLQRPLPPQHGAHHARSTHFVHAEAALSYRGNGDPVLRLKLIVSGLFLHTALQEKASHFIFEAAKVKISYY